MHLLLLAATTLLISFDGLRPDQITPQSAPNIYQLKQEGASAKYMEPIFPTSTFPNHTTIITGCTAEEHGIVSNHFIDAKKGKFKKSNDADWMECEPLWAAMSRQGKKSAIFAWPLAANPWRGIQATYTIPIERAMGKRGWKGKSIDEIGEWQQIIKWLKLPKNKRPDLIVGYFSDVDTLGHLFGPFSPRTRKAITRHDRMFGSFLKTLEQEDLLKDLNIVLVSDHGMVLGKKPVIFEPHLHQIKAMLKGTSWDISFSAATIVNFYLKDKTKIGAVMEELQKIPDIKAYSSENFPKHWHYKNPRSGDVVVTLDPPYYFQEPKWSMGRMKKGFHGYDPKSPDVHAFFAARGPNFKKIELDKILAIDVAPTLAKILGVSLNSKMSGRAVTSILK